MDVSQTISTQTPEHSALDYQELRKLGIAHIEKTASALWTDYNVHDPGITILELLCYVITDISYRTTESIPNLLAAPADTNGDLPNHFFSAASILPNKPATIGDYRKLLIDLVGVKNAWLQKTTIPLYADITRKKLQFTLPVSATWESVNVGGFYDVLLEFDTNVADAEKESIRQAARTVLMQNRNLCEDVLSITEVKQQAFRLCAELELKPGADPFDTVAQVFFRIQLYLTPLIAFFRLKELLQQGYTSDVLFEGPLLTHGFIKEEELRNSALKTEIHLSDVMQQILSVDGVDNILDIVFNPSDQTSNLENKWIIPVAPGKQPVLDITDANVLIYKNGIPLRPDMNIIKGRFQLLMANHIISNDQVTAEDISFDMGTFTNTGDYYSFQNHFPKNYGISHWGLPGDAGAQRRVQAKQLQGYLYFFDQQLANYVSQLSHLSGLFSMNQETTTCFTQVVKSFKDAEDVFVNKATIEADVQSAAEDQATYYKRRNLFLDHLLSRFAESFFDYVGVLNSGFSGNPKDVISPAVTNPEDIIQDKVAFLKNYPEYSAKRFCGYNYADGTNLWDTENISGLEKRLQRLLGFNNISRRNLVNLYSFIQHDVNESGVHAYWFVLLDHQTGRTLMEGTRKYAGVEQAAFDLEDALTALYGPENLRIIQNADSTFSYQLFQAGVPIGNSTLPLTSEAAADADRQRLLLMVTMERAEEGMFLLEHVLLLPDQEQAPDSPPSSPPLPSFDGFLPICVDDHCKDCEDKDPYSFRISIVLPAYAPRFLNLSFRQYCERTIRMEAPAHTFVKICWVSNEQLAEFQESYKDWLDVKAGGSSDPGNIKLDRLVTILTALRTIYPVARLEDCRSSEERTLFLLNQNALGTLKT